MPARLSGSLPLPPGSSEERTSMVARLVSCSWERVTPARMQMWSKDWADMRLLSVRTCAAFHSYEWTEAHSASSSDQSGPEDKAVLCSLTMGAWSKRTGGRVLPSQVSASLPEMSYFPSRVPPVRPAETCWFFPRSFSGRHRSVLELSQRSLGVGSVSSCSEIHSFTLPAPAVSRDDHSLSSSKVFSKRTVSLNLYRGENRKTSSVSKRCPARWWQSCSWIHFQGTLDPETGFPL